MILVISWIFIVQTTTGKTHCTCPSALLSSSLGYRSRVVLLLRRTDPPSLRGGRTLRATTAQALGGSRAHAALLQKLTEVGQTSQSPRLPGAEGRRESSRGGSAVFSRSDDAAFPVEPRPRSSAIRCGLQGASIILWSPLPGRARCVRPLVPGHSRAGWILQRRSGVRIDDELSKRKRMENHRTYHELCSLKCFLIACAESREIIFLYYFVYQQPFYLRS
eukprot:XP_028351728.1 uncharacterized protein LOC114487164 [Physeter catodon]